MSIVKNSPKSYAIFVRSSYGDLLMTDPLIKYIKKLNSQNIITLFVEDKNYQLAEFMENIDHIYSMPSKGNKYFYFVYYGLKYRQNKYDISIAAKTGVGSSNGFFPFILGAATKIAYVPESRRWTDWLVNKPVLFKEDIYHQQHYALGVLQLLEHKFDKIPEYLYPKLNHLNKLTKKKIKTRLLISISNNRSCCILNNSSISSVLNKLYPEFQFEIFISALEVDRKRACDLKEKINQSSTISITPKLKDYINLLSTMDLCFFGEGGSMHMAASLNIPQVVLFGFTSVKTWAPLSNLATILHDDSDVNNIPLDNIYMALKEKMKKISKPSNAH